MNELQIVPITVVIPTCNRILFLQKALDSLSELRRLPSEIIIVVDAASNQRELRLIQQYSNLKIKCILNKNQPGANGARNTGIEQANTQFILFLDDDDRVSSGYLSDTSIFSSEVLDKCYFGEKLFYLSKNLSEPLKKRTKLSKMITNEDLRQGNLIGTTSGVIMPTRVAKKIKFDEELPAMQDFDFWLRSTMQGQRFFLLENAFVKYTIHQGTSQISSDYNRHLAAETMILNKPCILDKNHMPTLKKSLFYMTQKVIHRSSHITILKRFIMNYNLITPKCVKLIIPYKIMKIFGFYST